MRESQSKLVPGLNTAADTLKKCAAIELNPVKWQCDCPSLPNSPSKHHSYHSRRRQCPLQLFPNLGRQKKNIHSLTHQKYTLLLGEVVLLTIYALQKEKVLKKERGKEGRKKNIHEWGKGRKGTTIWDFQWECPKITQTGSPCHLLRSSLNGFQSKKPCQNLTNKAPSISFNGIPILPSPFPPFPYIYTHLPHPSTCQINDTMQKNLLRLQSWINKE